jgi:hypothetical protein
MSKFTKALVEMGINSVSVDKVGANLVGWSTVLNSANAGGYMDPNNIDGYRFNSADGKWYGAPPPSPVYGGYWSNPVSSSMQATLNQMQGWRSQNNLVEGLTSANGQAGDVTAPSVLTL